MRTFLRLKDFPFSFLFSILRRLPRATHPFTAIIRKKNPMFIREKYYEFLVRLVKRKKNDKTPFLLARLFSLGNTSQSTRSPLKNKLIKI